MIRLLIYCRSHLVSYCLVRGGGLAALVSGGMQVNKQALVAAIAQVQYCGALATTAKGAMTALSRRQLHITFYSR